VVSHGAVVNLAEWLTDTFGFNEDTIFGGQCPFYFDASVKEIYSGLKNACTVWLIPKKLFMFPMKVMQYVQDHNVNVLPWAVSAMKIVANSDVLERIAPSGIEHVIFGGENMPAKILNIWKNAMPLSSFTNVYGPSEITVDCSYYTVDRDFDDWESIPIGTRLTATLTTGRVSRLEVRPAMHSFYCSTRTAPRFQTVNRVRFTCAGQGSVSVICSMTRGHRRPLCKTR